MCGCGVCVCVCVWCVCVCVVCVCVCVLSRELGKYYLISMTQSKNRKKIERNFLIYREFLFEAELNTAKLRKTSVAAHKCMSSALQSAFTL